MKQPPFAELTSVAPNATRQLALPAKHRDIARGLYKLAKLLKEHSKLGEAEVMLREAIAIQRENLGPMQ